MTLATATRPTLPRNGLEVDLLQLWWEILDADRFGVTDSFFELGGDSFQAVKLLDAIERQFGRRLPLASMIDGHTIERQAELLRAQNVVALWRSRIELAKGAGAPIAIAAAAHGHILQYRPLARYLGADRPIYGLQPPGLDGQTALLLTVEALASHYLRELRSTHAHGPYVFAGYSFGGLVAYEMAQQALRSGDSVPLLVLLDSHRPTALRFLARHASRLSALGWRQRLAYLVGQTQARIGKTLRAQERNRAHRRGEDVRLEGGRKSMKEVSDEAGRRYRPRSYAGDVLLIEGDRPCAALWRGLVSGAFQVERVACHHFDLLSEPHVRRVAELMRARMG